MPIRGESRELLSRRPYAFVVPEVLRGGSEWASPRGDQRNRSDRASGQRHLDAASVSIWLSGEPASRSSSTTGRVVYSDKVLGEYVRGAVEVAELRPGTAVVG